MPPRSRPTRSSRPATTPGADDPDHAELIEHVRERIDRERLHVPPQLEAELVELPFDLTTVSDKQLQQLHSAFASYSYRAGYLLALEEANESTCREAAEEIVTAYIAAHGDSEGTMTQIKAAAEQNETVKNWRHRQRRHGILAAVLRKDRDNYDKIVERLSRHESMRDGEWERAGNRNGGRRSK